MDVKVDAIPPAPAFFGVGSFTSIGRPPAGSWAGRANSLC
jgi:hypothetical protein